jgi:hypothetical protein
MHPLREAEIAVDVEVPEDMLVDDVAISGNGCDNMVRMVYRSLKNTPANPA